VELDMRKRAMKLLAAIFGSVVAVGALTAISEAALQEKDCLAAPDGQQADGGHWFYRIDPATNRRCWYVRGDGQESASASMKPANLRRSVADARAEIPAATEILQPKNAHRSSTIAIANTVDNDDAPAGARMPNPQSIILAELGSDNSDALAPAETAPANMLAGVRHRPRSASAKRIGHHEPRSIWMLLSALAGALALVGIATALLARLGSAIGDHNKRGRKRVIWSTQTSDVISTPVGSRLSPSDEAPLDWVRIARETQEISRQGEQIEQLLARVSRRSAV
jgi:hypothetical protein